MADDKADSRALDLCAIGLGQGGGNLAAEWRRRGYRGLLLNTARADFKALGRHEGLDVPAKYTIDIALEGSDGAGKDPEYGRACVRAHADEIRAAVEKQLSGADALLLCAGLGGGTGSACAELLQVLEDLEIPLLTVATLPSSSESGIAKVNAVKAVNHLATASLSGRVFIDNDRLMDAFPELDLVSFYPAVNARVLSPLDELNRLNRREDLWSIRSFDTEDLRKVLLSGGVLQTHVAKLRDDGPLEAEHLVEVIAACVDGGAHFARGLSLEDIAYLALVVVGPEKVLRATNMRVFDEAIRSLKEQSGGGAVYEGLYVGGDDEPLRAYVLSASFRLPARVSSLLGEAQSEGQELARKLREELPKLEISPLEGLELFRPTRRGRPAHERPRAPEPRPLADRLEGELPTLSRLRRKSPTAEPREAEAALEEPPAAPSVEEALVATVEARPGRADNPFAKQAPTSGANGAGEAPSDARPRVGTGRYDDEEAQALERTALYHADSGARSDALPDVLPEPAVFLDEKGKRVQIAERPMTKSRAIALTPRVGTGGWDEEEEADAFAAQEPTAMLEPLEAPERVPAPDPGARPRAETAPSPRAPVLPEDAPVDYDLDADPFEVALTNAGHRAPDSEAVDEEAPRETTRTDAVLPSFLSSGAGVDLSSIVDPSGNELQAIYEDLIERFRQAPDRRGRERIARRLIDDARADDVEIRALAVWAMVMLRDAGFRRALSKATADENPEIAKLASSGLEQLPG